MGFDTLFKKFFPGVVVALVLLAAYFQAAGVAQLLAGALLGEPDVAAPADTDGKPAAAVVARRVRQSAEAIIKRNPFDSETGPLDGRDIELPEAGAELPSSGVDLSDPLGAQECEGVGVGIITESPDPSWSLAVLKGPGEPKGELRRVGDKVGELTVAYIGFNPNKGSPAVWLATDRELCQALLFGAKQAAAAARPAPAAAPAPKARGGRNKAPTVPKEIKDGIEKVSPTEFNVDRAVIDNVLENQAQLMRSARIVPEQKDGKTVGIRLFGIRPETLLGTLGLQNGDRLEKINGFDMSSPEKALEAYARLRSASSLNVSVTRRGQPMTIEYAIK